MPELKTTLTPLDRLAPWLPSFDLHEENGELVLHADLMGFADGELALDGSDLLVWSEGEKRRLPLPFAPRALRAVSRSGHKDLEVRIPILSQEGAPMSWEEARNRELAHWFAIRDAIGTAAPVELLTEINAADAFCERAREETGSALGLCARCLFYQQFGGCRVTSSRMSERVAEGDWEGLRAMVDEVIDHVRALDVPVV
jgi:hypothetical protein